MRPALAICLSLCLLGTSATGAAPVVLGANALDGFQRLDLSAAKSAPQSSDSPLDAFWLDQLDTVRGQVQLDHKRPLRLSFKEPQSGLAVAVRDPRKQATLALTLYRGDHEVGRLAFAYRPVAGSRMARIENDRVAIASGTPFDRIELRRIDFAPSAPALQVDALWLADALAPEIKSQTEQSDSLACIISLAAAYNLSFFVSLSPDPISCAASRAGYVANLALKFCKPNLTAPPDVTRHVPAGQCAVELKQTHMAFGYQDALGIPLNSQSDWGELGTPHRYHHNTDVDVMLLAGNPGPPSAQLTDLGFLFSSGSFDASDKIWEDCDDDGSERYSQLDGTGPRYECPYVENRMLSFPVGHNTVVWRANPRLSPIDLVAVPICGVPPGAKVDPWKTLLKNVAKETLPIALDAVIDGWRLPNARTDTQSVIVFDEIPPSITPLPGSQGNVIAGMVGNLLQVIIEADEPGGVSRDRYENILRSFLLVSDACDRPTTLNVAFPSEALRSFWPVSTDTQDNSFQASWTARDPGPNQAGLSNETSRNMRIVVLDRQPPALIPPPDIVEVDSDQVTDLGQPAVFDLVDLNPQVSHNAMLPLGPGLHQVTWTAVDSAGNSSTAIQIVNVKSSNIPPVALAQTGPSRPDAISFEPTPIRLRGQDADGDPLRFKIEDQPENGFFVAPLHPYFIEDFRIEQSVTNDELFAICNNGQGGERSFELEFPSDPEFLTVTDDGRMYVVDKGNIKCMTSAPNPSDRVLRRQRLASFNSDGSLLNARYITGDVLRDVVFDPVRERIFLTSHASGGYSSMAVFDLDIQPLVGYRLQNLRKRIDGTSCDSLPQAGGGCTILRAHSSVVDDNDLIYVMIRDASIIVLDGTLPEDFNCAVDCGHTPTVVGVLEGFSPDANETGRALRLDAQGRLYASRFNRLFRYTASFVAEDGLAYPGSRDGWLGRCDIDLAPGDQAVCDVANRRSLGFSCTDEICGVHVDFNPEEQAICGPLGIGGQPRWGCRPGQFRGTPRSMDIAPDGTIYVADFGNARIQRFSPDGFFAGQAQSSGAGSGFVIGDFGNPQHVSVNSSRFYVLDPDTNLLHISLLTPFVEIGPDYADLVYQSNNQFACENSADCIDHFSFRVSDGVRDPLTGQPEVSAPAQVEVKVSRNFRPPFATPGISVVVLEDTPSPVLLDGSDPDPLDTLAFEIVDAPSKGSVVIDGQSASFVPHADAWGADSFSFRVSDGVFTSAPETVSVEIIEINDAPIISVPNEAIEGGTGYQMQLDLAFRDPDPDENHSVVIDWGDGTIEHGGGFNANGQPTGPILSHGGMASGRITAQHMYSSAGMKSIEVCVTDRMQPGAGGVQVPTPGLSLTACESIAAEISDIVDLRVSAGALTELALPGQDFSYMIQIQNRHALAGSGATATGVELAIRLAAGFDPASISVQHDCDRDGLLLFCSFDDLSSGQLVRFGVTAQVAGDTPPGELLVTEAEAFLDQTPLHAQTRVLLNTPVSRPADFRVGAAGDALKDDPDINPGDGQCASAAGVCTLRAAIDEAAAAATPQVIALANGLYLLNDLLEISSDITLIGNGPDQTRIHGARMQTRPGAGTLRIENLTLSGGGITAAPINTLSIRGVRFTDNENLFSFGGALQTNATALEIRDTTFDNNRSGVDGGSLMCFSCNGVLENVTVTGGSGGGLTFTGSGQVSLMHVTVVGTRGGSGWNTPAGAALHVYDNMNVSIANSVLSDNYSTGNAVNCAVSAQAGLISLGNNAFGDLSGCTLNPLASDRMLTSAQLLPLAIERNELPVRSPRFDSPLTDAFSDSSCLPRDARGLARPIDGNDDGIAWCDIGAAERRTKTLFRDGFED